MRKAADSLPIPPRWEETGDFTAAPGPEYPCHCITPPGPELPPIAPVPVSASGLMLVTAIVALVVLRGRSREMA